MALLMTVFASNGGYSGSGLLSGVLVLLSGWLGVLELEPLSGCDGLFSGTDELLELDELEEPPAGELVSGFAVELLPFPVLGLVTVLVLPLPSVTLTLWLPSLLVVTLVIVPSVWVIIWVVVPSSLVTVDTSAPSSMDKAESNSLSVNSDSLSLEERLVDVSTRLVDG